MIALLRRDNRNAAIIKIAAFFIFAFCLYRDSTSTRVIPTTLFFYLMVVGCYGAALGTFLFRWRPGQKVRFNPLQFQNGISTLGAVFGIMIVVPFFLWCLGLAVLPVMDLLAIYLPLLQSMMRIGCFYSGCCAGRIPGLQLYSSAALFIIFLLLQFDLASLFNIQGTRYTVYIMLISMERFVLDFWRTRSNHTFFGHRWLATLLFIGSAIFLYHLLLVAA